MSVASVLAAALALTLALAAAARAAETSTVTYTGKLTNTVEDRRDDPSNPVADIYKQSFTWTATWTGSTNTISDQSGETVSWTTVSLSGSDSIEYPDNPSKNCADSLTASPGESFHAIQPAGTSSIDFFLHVPAPKPTPTQGGGCAMPARLNCPKGSPPGENTDYCDPAPDWAHKKGGRTFDYNAQDGPRDVGGRVITSDLTSSVTVGGGCSVGGARAATVHGATAAKASSTNLVFYSARGSGEKRSSGDPLALGIPGLALDQVLKARANAGNVDLFADGDPYPALDISEGFWSDLNGRTRPTENYKRSVAAGVKDGVVGLTHIASQQDATGKCWQLVLSGYSQGAEVMRRVMDQLPGDVVSHVAAVAFFGDPYFEAGEARVSPLGGFRPGSVGARRVGWERFRLGPKPPSLRVHTYSWCRRRDLVCGLTRYPSTISGHLEYDKNACEAADKITAALARRGVKLGTGGCGG